MDDQEPTTTTNQSDEAYYPVETLQTHKRFDRASWKRQFKVQAPPYDPNRPPKAWVDGAYRTGTVEFNVFNRTTRQMETIKLRAEEASTPNLLGEYIYPKWIPASTPAITVHPYGGTTPISPNSICLRDEAEVLKDELGGTEILENRHVNNMFQISWQGEVRRIWMIRIAGQLQNAAGLLRRKYRFGVGAPGFWSVSNGQPVWTSDKQETGEGVGGEVLVPSRVLRDNEALYLDHPMKVVVYRTDMASAYNKSGEGDGDGLTPIQWTMIQQTNQLVREIHQKMVMDG